MGCDRQKPESPADAQSLDSNQTRATSSEARAPKSIGPQFFKYDLSDYIQVDTDVVSGLGGRWISVRYQRKPEASVTRDDMVAAIQRALQEDGWSAQTLPAHKYVLSQVWEKSALDLSFGRKAREGEPKNWFFNQVIHISQDGKTLCIYAEVGW